MEPYTTRQAAQALGIGEQTIRDHIRAGRLSAHRVGLRGLYKIDARELRVFAERYNYPLRDLRDAAQQPKPRS